MQGSVAIAVPVCRAAASVEKPNARDRYVVWIVGAALIALFLKIAMAYSTIGTNDVITFYGFARSLSDHGLEWTYRHSISFNHPPLTAYYLCWIYKLDQLKAFQENGIVLPFLLRLPGIVADLVVVLILLRIWKTDARLRRHSWTLVLFALSPVSLMISGFHGNTDSVMVMFLVIASYFCLRPRPSWCGVCLALSCQIKVIPLLFIPIFFFFWLHRRAIVSFLLPFVATSMVLWSEPLLKFPALFLRNVLSYGSFWGIWGITYWLRVTGMATFSWVWMAGFSPAQTAIATILKCLIVLSVFAIAWRRRMLDGRSLLESIAYGWLIFFVFSPGVCVQYMVWLAPFILVLSPTFYIWLTVTSTVFVFFFYNVTAHGLPWYLAVSTNALNPLWTPWALWPWAALIVGMILCWRKAVAIDPFLRLFSLETVPRDPMPQ